MRRIFLLTLVMLSIVLASCSSKPSSEFSIDPVLARLDSLDVQYGTNWRVDTFVTNASIEQLDELELALQDYARSIDKKNQTGYALLVASRGWMAQAQRLNAKQKQYGVESVAKIAETDSLVGIDCGRGVVFARAADVANGALYASEQSARTFGQMQKLVSQEDLARIGMPAFYSRNIAGLYTRSKRLHRAAVECEKRGQVSNVTDTLVTLNATNNHQ